MGLEILRGSQSYAVAGRTSFKLQLGSWNDPGLGHLIPPDLLAAALTVGDGRTDFQLIRPAILAGAVRHYPVGLAYLWHCIQLAKELLLSLNLYSRDNPSWFEVSVICLEHSSNLGLRITIILVQWT